MSGNACPICGCERSRTIVVREHRFVQDDVFTYAVCAQCRLVRLLTPPVAMDPYYADYYYHTAVRPRGRPAPTLWGRIHQRLAGLLMRPLERFVPRNRGLRVLDVGCARGEFPARLRDAGFQGIQGVEPSHEALKNRCDPSLPIACASLAEYETTERFDLITLNQVFEHCDDPRGSLLKLKRLLRPGGMLVMAFPNHRSLARLLFGVYWPGYDAPRHYYCFSPGNVRLLAEQCGMRVRRVRYISRPSQFLGGLQYLWNRLTGQKQRLEDGFFRNCKTLDLLLYLPAYVLNLLRLGDMIEVYLVAAEEGHASFPFPSSAWERTLPKLRFAAMPATSPAQCYPQNQVRSATASTRSVGNGRSQAELGNEDQQTLRLPQ